MVVTLSVSSVSNRLRSALQVNRCSITTHACIDGLVYKVDIEPELTAVIRDGLFQIIDEKLWRDAFNPWSASGRWRCHLFSLALASTYQRRLTPQLSGGALRCPARRM